MSFVQSLFALLVSFPFIIDFPKIFNKILTHLFQSRRWIRQNELKQKSVGENSFQKIMLLYFTVHFTIYKVRKKKLSYRRYLWKKSLLQAIDFLASLDPQICLKGKLNNPPVREALIFLFHKITSLYRFQFTCSLGENSTQTEISTICFSSESAGFVRGNSKITRRNFMYQSQKLSEHFSREEIVESVTTFSNLSRKSQINLGENCNKF